MANKPGKPFRVIARLLHDAAGDRGEEIQDETANKVFAVHNNNIGRRPLNEIVDGKIQWLPGELKKAKVAWNKRNPHQPFPDLEDPRNAAFFEELAQALQEVDHKKVVARMEGHPKEY